MKRSIKHLPKRTQEELNTILCLIKRTEILKEITKRVCMERIGLYNQLMKKNEEF